MSQPTDQILVLSQLVVSLIGVVTFHLLERESYFRKSWSILFLLLIISNTIIFLYHLNLINSFAVLNKQFYLLMPLILVLSVILFNIDKARKKNISIILIYSIILLVLILCFFSFSQNVAILFGYSSLFGLSVGYLIVRLDNNTLFNKYFYTPSHEYQKYNSEIHMPEEFITITKQFLLFFPQYIEKTKGEKLELEINDTISGININIKLPNKLPKKKIKNWFTEYIELSKKRINLSLINFEKKCSIEEAGILLAELKNEITFLKEGLKIIELETNKIDIEQKYYKQIFDSFK